MAEHFKALVVSESHEGKFERRICDRNIEDLPEGDTLVRVDYSSLNYKDALSASGNRGITRHYPHTPGIDAAGSIVESAVFSPGEEVIVMGHDLGMNTSGGFGQYLRVPADWVMKQPKGLSLAECMTYGTAGFTAALAMEKLIMHGVEPDSGEILVTGATGGVGSMAVAILAKLGYQVVASTGKLEMSDWLAFLGASEVVHRDELRDDSGRPMLKGRWAGVVDTVGGEILSSALKSAKYGASVTCCGMVASNALCTSIFPFILRGISLLGIDAVQCPMEHRIGIWEKLASGWKPECLGKIGSVCTLEELDRKIDDMLGGNSTGRVVVSMRQPQS
jgi:putative YhdH/YhfP family quinone oxidoreductase